MYYYPLVLLAFVLIGNASIAQTDSTKTHALQVISGVGNYEEFYLGLEKNISSKGYLEGAIGLRPYNRAHEKYYMSYICYGERWVAERKRRLVPSRHLKLLFWHLENDVYAFTFLGINPELRLSFSLNKKFTIYSSGGIVYNTMLAYNRKTYNDVGWPREFQPSFSLHLSYILK